MKPKDGDTPQQASTRVAPPAKKPIIAKPVGGRAPTQPKSPWVMPVTQSRPMGTPMAGTNLPGVQNMQITANPTVRAGYTRPKSREVGKKNA